MHMPQSVPQRLRHTCVSDRRHYLDLNGWPDCKVTAHCLCPGAVSSNYMNATMAENFAELPEEKRAERFEKVSGTMSNMMKSMMTPAKMAEVLADKIGDGNFYIVGFDGGQPKEMLHTMQ